MKKIITAILVLIISVTALTAFTSCKDENAPSTGWNVKKYELETGETTESGGNKKEDVVHKLGFYVGDGTKKISEVWVNIAKIYNGTADLSLDVYTGDLKVKTSTPTYPAFKRSVTIDEVKKAKKERHGWVKLDFNDKWKNIAANKQIMLTVKGEFDFNEIAFVGTDGKLLSVSLEKLDYWYERKDGSVVMNAKNKTDIAELEKSPLFLIDEQSKFELRDKK